MQRHTSNVGLGAGFQVSHMGHSLAASLGSVVQQLRHSLHPRHQLTLHLPQPSLTLLSCCSQLTLLLLLHTCVPIRSQAKTEQSLLLSTTLAVAVPRSSPGLCQAPLWPVDTGMCICVRVCMCTCINVHSWLCMLPSCEEWSCRIQLVMGRKILVPLLSLS